jgi:hypothetical protein
VRGGVAEGDWVGVRPGKQGKNARIRIVDIPSLVSGPIRR